MALFVTALTLAPGALQAQAHAGCATKPQQLAQMRGCYRPLLVFSPGARDPRLHRQQAALDQAADDMMDRNVLYMPILAEAKGFTAPLDTPYTVLAASALSSLRSRFKIKPGEFRVILLGEDGSTKLQSSAPVSIDRLDGLIDTMPNRKREMQQPHTN